MKPSILVVIPTYNHFEYAEEAIASAFSATTNLDVHVQVVDDASPNWPGGEQLLRRFECDDNVKDRYHVSVYDKNGGLTRSWNHGLVVARDLGFTYCCVTNSDVYFPPAWDQEIVEGLRQHALVGPVTNAPGTNKDQYVRRYSMIYDTPKAGPALHDEIGRVQHELLQFQKGRFKKTTLNGFCMIAKTKTWWEHAFDHEHVFKPRNDFNSKGEPNPTPLMTLNEYELQGRWHAKGLTSAVCLGSYVFHYRAVSRGDGEKRGDWVRKEGT